MYSTPQDGIDNGACHTPRIGHYDTSKADIYKFLFELASVVDELDQILRRLPFLGPDIGVVQEPVPYDPVSESENMRKARCVQTRYPDPFWPVQRWRNDGWAKVVKKWYLMGLHLVQRCARKPQRVTSPSIDLSGCSSPENLVKHHIRLISY